MIVEHNTVKIYFGDKKDGLTTTFYLNLNEPHLLDIAPFKALTNNLPLHALMFTEQVHGTHGIAVDSATLVNTKAFSVEGDYVMTNVPGIGLGVMSADCLPVIIIDTKHRAIAAIHSGWRGTVKGIVIKALQHMNVEYGTQVEDVTVIFGPAAGACCYEVQSDFLDAIPQQLISHSIIERDGKIYFDNTAYNIQLLKQRGVQSQQIITQHNICTMCEPSYCSYRRDKSVDRQMSVVTLV
ncbi:laccase domain protein [Candidatus Dependentiae bacterium Noda2021]|nr:laccase domain protein [Candidatus Dependentiae bacterium Noda2021]